MDSRSRIPIILVALAALTLLAPAAAGAAERTVSVSASATLKVPNDSAGLGFSVSRERRHRGAALRAVSNGLRRVIAAVQGIPGVGPGDVTTGRISVRKVPRGKRVVFRVDAGIGVILHRPESAGALVSAALAAGATGISGPNFFVGDTEAAFTAALAAAFDKARAKASALAAKAGAILGPALAIDEGSGPELTFEDTAKSTPASSCVAASPTKRRSPRCAAPPPVKPSTSTVTATVHAVFELR